MRSATPQEPARRSRGGAFTLVEIVVSLTIITVVAAIAIPTIKGLRREDAAMQPVRDLATLALDVRQRAMHERRAYQIVFERSGIHACETGLPDQRRDEFLQKLEERRTPPKELDTTRTEPVRTEVETPEPARGEGPSWLNARPLPVAAPAPSPSQPAPTWEPPWTVSLALPEKSELSVLMWGDTEWVVVEGDDVVRWVFQSGGVASPARVRLRLGDLEMQTTFDALTAEVVSERLGPTTTLP